MPAGDPYIPIDTLYTRVSYDPDDFFQDNEEKRFNELLEQLEDEARGLVNTRTGDQTFHEEIDRVDEFRTTDDAAYPLVYPINDISEVEIKRSQGADFEVLGEDRWDYTDHRLILEGGRRSGNELSYQRTNPIARTPTRMTWRDLATNVRVTYDRGFSPIPPDIQSVTVSIVNQLLRQLRTEQNIAAMEPEQITAVTEASAVLTDDIRTRIDQISGLGGKTWSV